MSDEKVSGFARFAAMRGELNTDPDADYVPEWMGGQGDNGEEVTAGNQELPVRPDIGDVNNMGFGDRKKPNPRSAYKDDGQTDSFTEGQSPWTKKVDDRQMAEMGHEKIHRHSPIDEDGIAANVKAGNADFYIPPTIGERPIGVDDEDRGYLGYKTNFAKLKERKMGIKKQYQDYYDDNTKFTKDIIPEGFKEGIPENFAAADFQADKVGMFGSDEDIIDEMSEHNKWKANIVRDAKDLPKFDTVFGVKTVSDVKAKETGKSQIEESIADESWQSSDYIRRNDMKAEQQRQRGGSGSGAYASVEKEAGSLSVRNYIEDMEQDGYLVALVDGKTGDVVTPAADVSDSLMEYLGDMSVPYRPIAEIAGTDYELWRHSGELEQISNVQEKWASKKEAWRDMNIIETSKPEPNCPEDKDRIPSRDKDNIKTRVRERGNISGTDMEEQRKMNMGVPNQVDSMYPQMYEKRHEGSLQKTAVLAVDVDIELNGKTFVIKAGNEVEIKDVKDDGVTVGFKSAKGAVYFDVDSTELKG